MLGWKILVTNIIIFCEILRWSGVSNVCLGIKNIFELWESSWEESIFQNYTHNGDITSLELFLGAVFVWSSDVKTNVDLIFCFSGLRFFSIFASTFETIRKYHFTKVLSAWKQQYILMILKLCWEWIIYLLKVFTKNTPKAKLFAWRNRGELQLLQLQFTLHNDITSTIWRHLMSPEGACGEESPQFYQIFKF